MPTPLSQTDICNIALAQIGALAISSLADTANTSSVACATTWPLAFLAVAREHNWNCLTTDAVLSPVPQIPIVPVTPPPGTTNWAPFTAYAANAYVIYGDPTTLYQALIAHTSTASFINDLTSAFWFQTDDLNPDPFCSPGQNYPSGWGYKYSLPADFVKLIGINGQCDREFLPDNEVQGRFLFTDASSVVITYVAALADTTIYDSLFTNALVFMLASKIATTLRQDSGQISAQMTSYYVAALREARMKDANEGTPRRFNPVANSLLVASRYRSTNN